MKSRLRTIIKRVFLVLIPIFFLGGIYLTLFGSLNFISPWIIGFDKHETKRAVIHYHSDDVDIDCLAGVDSMIAMVESFHDLKFGNKVDLIICNDLKEHKRYTLNQASFMTMPVKGRIYILYNEEYFSNKAAYLHHYLRHELSHAVINQNISIFKYVGYPLWFLEGVATYSSNMMGIEGYSSANIVKERICEGHFIHPKDWGNFGLAKKGETVLAYKLNDLQWFAYSEFAYLIDDLIRRYGKEKMIHLLHNSLKEKDFDKVFEAEYKISLERYLELVKEEVRSNKTASM